MAYSKNRRLAEIVSDTSGNLSVEGIIVPTQSSSDNDTSAASTAFVHAHIDAVLDSAPGTLNTLNEIAAALKDDANFNTTVTNAIAAKLPLAGGTMTGSLILAKADNTFTVQSTNAGQASVDIKNTEGHYRIITDAGELKVYDQTDTRTPFIINSNGRVAIGIAAADAPLHIEDTTSSAYGGLKVVGAGTGSGSTNVRQIADFGRTDSGSVSGVWLGGRTDETTAVIGAKTASGNIAFEVYNSGWQERMRITNLGTVLVGKTTETTATDGIELNRQDVIVATRNGDSPLILNRRTSDGDIAVFRKDNTVVGSIGAKDGDIFLGTGDTGLRFIDGSDAITPHNISTNAGRDNAIDLGTTGARFKDLHLSGVAYATQVGIGTASPTKSLSVKAPSGSNGGIDVFHSNGNKVAELVHSGSGDEGRLSLLDSGSTTVQFMGETGQNSYINSGNVGIGQSAPATTLHIGDGASHYVRIENAGSGDVSSGYQIYRGSSVGMSLYDNPADNTTSLQCAGSLNINAGGSGADLHVNTNGNVGIGTTSTSANFQINGSTDSGGATQNMLIKNTTTASFSSTAFVGTGRVLDLITNSSDNQDFSAIRFANAGGSRETAIAVVQDNTTTRDGTGQGDLVIQGYDGDSYIETQRFRANGASSSTGQRRTGSYTSFAYINHTYTFDHAGYSTAGTPANSNDHWLEVPIYSSYSSSAGGGWCEIDICWHATHAQAGHLHSYKLLWGSNHGRILNVSVVSSSANATTGSYGPYRFTSSSELYRHPTAGDAYMSKMYIEIKGSTNHSGARSITLRGVGHPSVKNLAPIIDHGSDSTPDGITPTSITSALTVFG